MFASHVQRCAFLFLASCLAAPGPAPAADATPKLPPAVAADVKSNADQCTEAGGKVDTKGAVQRADLNGDGIEDYVTLAGWIRCEGFASLYGDREKAVAVYVGDGKGGATAAFNDFVFDAKIEGAGAAARLWLDVMGQMCGKKPAADFASEHFCSRAIVWNAKTKKFDYAPVSTVRMIE